MELLTIVDKAVPAGLDNQLSAGKLQHAQDGHDPQLAAAPAGVPPPLHALEHLVDQPSRARIHRGRSAFDAGPSTQALETAIKEYLPFEVRIPSPLFG